MKWAEIKRRFKDRGIDLDALNEEDEIYSSGFEAAAREEFDVKDLEEIDDAKLALFITDYAQNHPRAQTKPSLDSGFSRFGSVGTKPQSLRYPGKIPFFGSMNQPRFTIKKVKAALGKSSSETIDDDISHEIKRYADTLKRPAEEIAPLFRQALKEDYENNGRVFLEGLREVNRITESASYLTLEGMDVWKALAEKLMLDMKEAGKSSMSTLQAGMPLDPFWGAGSKFIANSSRVCIELRQLNIVYRDRTKDIQLHRLCIERADVAVETAAEGSEIVINDISAGGVPQTKLANELLIRDRVSRIIPKVLIPAARVRAREEGIADPLCMKGTDIQHVATRRLLEAFLDEVDLEPVEPSKNGSNAENMDPPSDSETEKPAKRRWNAKSEPSPEKLELLERGIAWLHSEGSWPFSSPEPKLSKEHEAQKAGLIRLALYLRRSSGGQLDRETAQVAIRQIVHGAEILYDEDNGYSMKTPLSDTDTLGIPSNSKT